MLIQCTKKLLDQLKVTPSSSPPEEKALFSWHANLLTINRRKTVVLVNDSNRYVIVLHGLLAKDFKNLDTLIIEAIQSVFRAEKISKDVIEQFLQHSRDFTYTKTKDRTSVARMNRSIDPVPTLDEYIDQQELIQTSLSYRASRFLVGDGTDNYIEPNQELYKDLKTFTGKPAIQIKAVQMKVTLTFNRIQVWRRIVIPLHLTFRHLHKALQLAFGWKDYHLHEFYVYDRQAKDIEPNTIHPAFSSGREKPILNIVSDEEAFEYGGDIPMKLDTDIKLSDDLPNYKSLTYHYDFGDNWRHEIKVEKFIDQYDKTYPSCLEGEGNAPPEDVGGEPGFEEFLKILADKNHPDHKQMVSWGRMQGYEDFDLKIVNFWMKHKFVYNEKYTRLF